MIEENGKSTAPVHAVVMPCDDCGGECLSVSDDGVESRKCMDCGARLSAEKPEERECSTCGIGFRLPSGRCDHCDTMFEA